MESGPPDTPTSTVSPCFNSPIRRLVSCNRFRKAIRHSLRRLDENNPSSGKHPGPIPGVFSAIRFAARFMGEGARLPSPRRARPVRKAPPVMAIRNHRGGCDGRTTGRGGCALPAGFGKIVKREAACWIPSAASRPGGPRVTGGGADTLDPTVRAGKRAVHHGYFLFY